MNILICLIIGLSVTTAVSLADHGYTWSGWGLGIFAVCLAYWHGVNDGFQIAVRTAARVAERIRRCNTTLK